MTTSTSSKQLDPSVASLLSSHLLNKGLFLTYRLLSRELPLHVQEARSALQTFYEQQASGKLKACWVVQGTLKPMRERLAADVEDEVTEEAIFLVGEDKLEETKALFSPTPSVQIYSLSPASPSSSSLTSMDLANFSTVPLLLSSETKYIQAWEQADRGKKLGVIWNERVSEGDPRAVAAAREQAQQQAKAQALAKVQPTAAKPVKEEKKAVDCSASTSQASKGSGLNWSKAKAKTTPDAPAAAASSSKAKLSKKPEPPPKIADDEDEPYDSDVEMAQIGYADSEGEMDEVPAGKAKTKRADGLPAPKSTAGEKGTGKKADDKAPQRKASSKAELEKMMDMDDDDGPGEAIPDVEAANSATTSLMQGTEDEGKETSNAAPVRRKVRRQKRTVRKQRSKDEKGYMRTQEVSDYESYSDWTESEETAPAKKGGAKSSSTGNAKNKAARTESASSAGTATRGQKSGASASAADEESQGAAAVPPSPEKEGTTPARPSKSPSPSKQASTGGGAQKSGNVGGGAGAGGGGTSSKAKGGQSKLSSFFKKG